MPTVTSVYKNVKGLRSAIQDMGRFRQIVTILVKHGFGALLTQLKVQELIGFKYLRSSTAESNQHVSFAKRLRLALEDLGPTFIKLGQIFSTRSDLLPPELITELEYLQDNTVALPWPIIKAAIEQELQEPIEKSFKSIEKEPLASASIAQVHRATLQSGEQVVVKVQRPDIQPCIASDLNIMAFMAARAAALAPEMQSVDPQGIVHEFDRALSKELNFDIEKNNILRFQKNFSQFPNIRIPEVYEKYCTKNILTIEFLAGVKITDAPAQYDVDPYQLASHIIKILFKMILEDGFFHGDMHPGNVLVDKNGVIGLIDFGLMGRLLPRHQELLLELIHGISREDYESVARLLFDLSIKKPSAHYDYCQFESDVIQIMEDHIAGKTLEHMDAQVIFAELLNGAIQHQLTVPSNFTLVFKAMMTIEGIGKCIAPDINLLDSATPLLESYFKERYTPTKIMHEGLGMLINGSKFFRQLSQAAPQLLRNIEQGHMHVKVQMENVDQIVQEQRRSNSTLIKAILAGACLIGGIISIDPATPLRWQDQPVGIACFVAAGVLALPMLVRQFFERK